MTNTNYFGYNQPVASGSSFKPKRKFGEDESDEENDKVKQFRVCSPKIQCHNAYPPPELMTDHSTSGSDEEHNMDMDMDMDRDEGNIDDGFENGPVSHQPYHFSDGGSGGFGFGPGAEEDDMGEVTPVKSGFPPALHANSQYYSHPNPHHYSNRQHPAKPFERPTSPWSAQAYSTSLRAPTPIRGLLQPTVAGPLSADANAVEKARAKHGPHCRSIPKLVMSQYPDANGVRSMYTVCGDCGATELAA